MSRTAQKPSGGIHADRFEILFIAKGRVRFSWAGHACESEAPLIFLVAPSTPHALESLDPEIGCYFLELSEVDDPMLTAANIDRWNLNQPRWIDDPYAPFWSEIEHALLFVHRLQLLRETGHHEALEQACLLEIGKVFKLVAHILSSTGDDNRLLSGKKHRWSAREAVDIVINFMEWRYGEEITLKMLSDLVHLNPSYLVRVFKAHTNYTPFEYLQTLRLKAAVSYLTRSSLPLRVIVEKTGFNSIHYFCRLFRKTYGDSPIRWRDRQAPEPR